MSERNKEIARRVAEKILTMLYVPGKPNSSVMAERLGQFKMYMGSTYLGDVDASKYKPEDILQKLRAEQEKLLVEAIEEAQTSGVPGGCPDHMLKKIMQTNTWNVSRHDLVDMIGGLKARLEFLEGAMRDCYENGEGEVWVRARDAGKAEKMTDVVDTIKLLHSTKEIHPDCAATVLMAIGYKPDPFLVIEGTPELEQGD